MYYRIPPGLIRAQGEKVFPDAGVLGKSHGINNFLSSWIPIWLSKLKEIQENVLLRKAVQEFSSY